MVEGHNIREKAADPWHGVCASDVKQRLARERPAVWAKMQKSQASRPPEQEQADVDPAPTLPPLLVRNCNATERKAYGTSDQGPCEQQMALFRPTASLL